MNCDWRPIDAFEHLISDNIHSYLAEIKMCMNITIYEKLLNVLFKRKIIQSESYIVLPNNLDIWTLCDVIEAIYRHEKISGSNQSNKINKQNKMIEYLTIHLDVFKTIYDFINDEIVIEVLNKLDETCASVLILESSRFINTSKIDPLYYLLQCVKNEYKMNLKYLPSNKRDQHKLLLRFEKYVDQSTYYHFIDMFEFLN
jgi:hypothetical protein